jgi:predicted MFS family arabinose efflux permease
MLRAWFGPPWNTITMRALFAARILMSVARSLAGIVVPIYLAEQGYSALKLGFLFVCVGIASALMSTAIGAISDRLGRKPFLVTIPLFMSVAGVVFAVTRSVPAIFLAASFGSFGRGAGAGAGAVGPYQPAESALVTESIGSSQRNDAFARLSLGSTIGALIGGLVATSVGGKVAHGASAIGAHGTATLAHGAARVPIGSYRVAFLAIAGMGIGAAILGSMVVDRSLSRSREQRAARLLGKPSSGESRGFWPRRSMAILVRLWIANGVNGIAIGMFGPFITYWLYRRYGVGPAQVGLLFALVNLASLISPVIAPMLARRFHTIRTIVVVRVLQALLIVPMVLSPYYWMAGGIYIVRMIAQRVALPLRQSYAVGMADPTERARVAALSNLPAQAAMSLSPLLAGYLFDEVSLALPFELSAGLQLINAGLYQAFFHDRPPEEERPTEED